MKAISGWQRKLVLLFLSEKRLDAPIIMKNYNNKSFDEMKNTIITDGTCDSAKLTNKPRTNDLQSHLDNLKHQFIGRSELCFYHATLIVLLRRSYKVEQTFTEFEQLWTAETDYLLEHLSLRWIVSGCDTFIDHSINKNRAAILMNVVTLMNTLRVYETREFIHLDPIPKTTALNNTNVAALYKENILLYDDLTYFRIGSDDTLKNMRDRYKKFSAIDKLATDILLAVFDKLQNNESAFSAMRSLHKSEKSKWWLE